MGIERDASRRNRNVDYCLNVCGDEFCGREARGELLRSVSPSACSRVARATPSGFLGLVGRHFGAKVPVSLSAISRHRRGCVHPRFALYRQEWQVQNLGC